MKTKLATPTVLKNIFDRKIEEVAERKQQRPLSDLERAAAVADPVRGFRASLAHRVAEGEAAVIAEVKKASPSKGVIREDFHPAEDRGELRGGRRGLLIGADRYRFLPGSGRISASGPGRVFTAGAAQRFHAGPLSDLGGEGAGGRRDFIDRRLSWSFRISRTCMTVPTRSVLMCWSRCTTRRSLMRR